MITVFSNTQSTFTISGTSIVSMYDSIAPYYDAIYGFKDYSTASAKLLSLIRKLNPAARTLLDAACGTGRHLEYLREHYDVQGLDISEPLLEVAQKRCPGVPFHHEDMKDFHLGGTFDVITCLFSSIGFAGSVENLNRTISRFATHLNPGGVLIVESWLTPENYVEGKVTLNVVETDEVKIAWMYAGALRDRLSVFDIHYLIGTGDGVKHAVEHQELGLFSQAEYLDAFEKAGLEVTYDAEGLFGYGMYFGTRKSF